jgi:CubicO group peptidase (beta-lactamase class C family)
VQVDQDQGPLVEPAYLGDDGPPQGYDDGADVHRLHLKLRNHDGALRSIDSFSGAYASKLVSTSANGGALSGKRLLGKQMVAFMTADHVGNRPGRPPGLGFEVRTTTGEAALPGSVGEYGWAGNAGTLFWIDPKEQLIAIYMVQVSDPDRIALRNQFRTMVQSAIID